MPIAIVGTGRIGSTLARHLVAGGERLIVSGLHDERADALATELGPRVAAAPVAAAIALADTVVFAVWLDVLAMLIGRHGEALCGKVVIDPSSPFARDPRGRVMRWTPPGMPAASIVASSLPRGARYVKAFGAMSAQVLADAAWRLPTPATLFYAVDDRTAARCAVRLACAAGFEPMRAGAVADAGRIEPGGDLYQHGALAGRYLTRDRALYALQRRAA